MLSHIPVVGPALAEGISGTKETIKYMLSPEGIFFEEIGFTYIGPVDGHDIEKLEDVLREAKSCEGCSLVLVKTKKGKGYKKGYKMDIKNKKLFLLDMDGTLYLGNRLFEGVTDFLALIKEKGGRYMFLTNNSSKSADAYVEKLGKLGIKAQPSDFFTSTEATISYLLKNGYKNKKIYAFGTKSFRKQLSDAGLDITDKYSKDIDVLLCGFDTENGFAEL